MTEIRSRSDGQSGTADSGGMHAADALVLRLLRDRIGDPIALYRFGSSVAGALRAESDLDYAVLATRPLEAVEHFDLQ